MDAVELARTQSRILLYQVPYVLVSHKISTSRSIEYQTPDLSHPAQRPCSL